MILAVQKSNLDNHFNKKFLKFPRIKTKNAYFHEEKLSKTIIFRVRNKKTIRMTIVIKDADFAGKVLNEILLDFKTEEATVREIIEKRVQQEVENYNAKLPKFYNGLVMPSEAEKTINGFQVKNKNVIDSEKQVYVALDAFTKNGFFILVDDLQVESLDEVVTLRKDMNINFVKLTPLVGG